MLPSYDGTQEIDQILQGCGITGLVRYTLEHVLALYALDEESKSSYCSDELQSKVGGFRESIRKPFMSVKAFVRALMIA